MSLMMAYRMTASCMPAAMSYFAEKLSATEASIWSDEIEESEEQDHEKGVLWTGPARQSFLDLVTLYNRLVKQDSKLTELINALTTIWSEDTLVSRPRRKVVIFSFFRRTLEYLRRQLSEREIQNRMIHGGIAVDDREAAIDDFLESPAIPVLLTSEVGGEGLDLQQASVVINYDLPWNPMVVEQRIGRVDRIGQEAERIVILNLIIQESIEETVLRRFLDKIEIFRGSIGEMDDIIGEQVERITAAALRGELSGEELERIVEEQGNAIARRIQEARTLLTKVDGLLAADQALIDEINSVVGERQIPAEPELFKFLNRVFEKRVSGCQLPASAVRGVVEVDLRRLAPLLEEHAPTLGADALAFARKLGSGSVHLTLSREAGYTHPRVELIHGQHPLTRYAVAEVARDVEQRQAAFAMELITQDLPAGDYAFLIASILIRSHRPSTKLVAVFVNRHGEEVWWEPDETAPLVIQMLEEGRDVEVEPLVKEESEALQGRLLLGLQNLKTEWEARESRLDQARREQQLASRRATLEFLANRAEDRLNSLVERRAAPFAVRMAEARVEKTRRELNAFLSAPIVGTWGGIEHEEVAVGLLRVEPEGGNA